MDAPRGPTALLAAALEGVPAAWKQLFRPSAAALGRAAGAVWAAQAAGTNVVPPVPQIFAAFRYTLPENVAAVVVGQDPYHAVAREAGEAQAQGLCFSCNPNVGAAQPSLANIRDAVVCDLVAGAPPAAERTNEAVAALCASLAARGAGVTLHDLRFWAAQGVLLLNRALTTVEGTAGAHESAWADFTLGVIRALLDEAAAKGRPPPPFLLWGESARKLAPAVRAAGALALEWSHPSPLADNRLPAEKKFRSCGHFRAANEAAAARGLRQVVWLELPTLAASDGACSKNGAADARAGYGACVLTGPLRGLDISGPVAPQEYEWAAANTPLAGFRPKPGTTRAPTNIRGEFLAACYLFLALARAGLTQPVEVVVDLELIIKTLDVWLPSWVQKGVTHKKQNMDLINIAATLLRLARERGRVALTHHRGHQSAPSGSSRLATLRWSANARADALAGAGLGQTALTVSAPFYLP